MMSETGDSPKIQVDSDWKSQAQAEKEKLRESEEETRKAAAEGGGADGAAGRMPPANWDSLLGTFVTQAMMYLGGFADPRTGQPMIELDVARHYIDLLTVLEEKTKGNLSEDDEKNLSTVIYELRMRYVQLAQSGGAAAMGAGAAGDSIGMGAGASSMDPTGGGGGVISTE